MPALVTLALAALSGCSGSSSGSQTRSVSTTYNEGTAEQPFSHVQQLIEKGGQLFVRYGCEACHSLSGRSPYGPSFSHLAGTHVTLSDGRRVLVNEAYLRAAVLEPAANSVRGYSPAPMIAAVRRLKLGDNHEAVAALAAFIEEIGPEEG